MEPMLRGAPESSGARSVRWMGWSMGQGEMECLGRKMCVHRRGLPLFTVTPLAPELDRRIGHQAADLAQPDDAQRLSGQLDAQRLSFDMQLPTTSCQALLDATPGISRIDAQTTRLASRAPKYPLPRGPYLRRLVLREPKRRPSPSSPSRPKAPGRGLHLHPASLANG